MAEPGAAGLWPWLALAGLGAFHGLNPAMGWLFAVALGLHRGGRRTVLTALLPIAVGHGFAVLAVVLLALALGTVLDPAAARRLGGLVLLGWAAWHGLRGHRQRLRFGLTTGMAGLAAWSFLMATAHGAGLMLLPLLAPTGAVVTPGHHHAHAAAGLAPPWPRSPSTASPCSRPQAWWRCWSTTAWASPSCAAAGSTSTGSGPWPWPSRACGCSPEPGCRGSSGEGKAVDF